MILDQTKYQESVSTVLIVLTYNHEDCIEECLRSLVQQSDGDFRVLIVDDHSKDKTWEIITNFSKYQANFDIFQNTSNLGGSANFEYVAQLALDLYPESKFFSWIGPDDLYAENWLATLKSLLKSAPYAQIAQSSCIYDYGDSKQIFRYDDIPYPFKSWKTARKIQNGYGQLLHGLWKRDTLILFSKYKLSSRDYFFRLEPFSICYLIQLGEFISAPEPLMTKRKSLSSNFRYPGDLLYGRPTVSFLEQCRYIIPITIRCMSEQLPSLLISSLITNLFARLNGALTLRFKNIKKW
jgi:glycosyltransferase involved in cell wall biosynthesis